MSSTDEGTTKENFKMNLREAGLFVSGATTLGAELTFEQPVRLRSVDLAGTKSIGARSYIEPLSQIRNASIGRFCSVAANVAIGPAEHPLDRASTHPDTYLPGGWFNKFDGPSRPFSCNTVTEMPASVTTNIGHDVWIGRNAVVRRGVSVGSGAVIGAGSFVNEDVPPYAVVAGSPARIIRHRFPGETIDALLELGWWDYMPPENEKFDFSSPTKLIKKIRLWKNSGSLREYRPKRFTLAAADRRQKNYKIKHWGCPR